MNSFLPVFRTIHKEVNPSCLLHADKASSETIDISTTLNAIWWSHQTQLEDLHNRLENRIELVQAEWS